MAKQKTIINGYTIPSGRGGVAVRKACELLIANPGMAQSKLHEEACYYAGISSSHTGWLVNPNDPKCPLPKLWNRNKEGVFRHYPNEFTKQGIGSEQAIFDLLADTVRSAVRKSPYVPKVGDLIDDSGITGLFIGYELLGKLYDSPDEIIELGSLSGIKQIDSVYLRFIQNGNNALRYEYIGNMKAIRPV